jgi:hypothetical protein
MGSSVSSRKKAGRAGICGLEQSGEPPERSESGLSGAQSTTRSGQTGQYSNSDLPEARLNGADCAALPDDVAAGMGKRGKDSVKVPRSLLLTNPRSL